MPNFKSDFLHIMSERGFIHQLSDAEGLDALLSKKCVSGYIGFDPTAPSLHAGSLIQIMMLHWFQKTGHRPIVLIGGGTGRVGDPSFKDEARQLLSLETLKQNVIALQKVFQSYLRFGTDGNDALLLDNASWLCNLNYLDFLRDTGRFFSINRMLSFESVKQRLDREQSLSFLEFNYMILQAYDFVTLHKNYGVELQMGGSDQWGNIINGIDLGHRTGTDQLYALTSPLLTTSSGAKMGKSQSGAIWLNQSLFSAYNFWQYWRNTEDADVGRFLRLYTTLPLDEISRLENLKGTEINEAKKILATEVTALLHGTTAAQEAAETARKTFEDRILSEQLPTVILSQDTLKTGIGVLALLVKVGLAKSNSEARRHIEGGAIKINDIPFKDEKKVFYELPENTKLSFGKKKHILLKVKA